MTVRKTPVSVSVPVPAGHFSLVSRSPQGCPSATPPEAKHKVSRYALGAAQLPWAPRATITVWCCDFSYFFQVLSLQEWVGEPQSHVTLELPPEHELAVVLPTEGEGRATLAFLLCACEHSRGTAMPCAGAGRPGLPLMHRVSVFSSVPQSITCLSASTTPPRLVQGQNRPTPQVCCDELIPVNSACPLVNTQ